MSPKELVKQVLTKSQNGDILLTEQTALGGSKMLICVTDRCDWFDHIMKMDAADPKRNGLAQWTIEHVWITAAQYKALSEICGFKI